MSSSGVKPVASEVTGQPIDQVADQFTIYQVDYANLTHGAALVSLLDAYAKDPMGGGEGLSDFAKTNLVTSLAARPQAFSVLAAVGNTPVGLVNCIEGFSTFACKPLVNVHDVVVLPGYRSQGIAAKMLSFCETLARDRGACKLTLEVLQGNLGAMRVYQRFGFAGYQLGSTSGQAQFMQKWLK